MNTTTKQLLRINELSGLSKEELTAVIRQYLDELCAHGLRQDDISEKVGLSRISIWRIRNGKQSAAGFHGMRIANLHAEVFRQKRSARGKK